jgi:hypothetical protein
MPYKFILNSNNKDYKLIVEKTGQIIAKHTTRKKGLKQIQAIEISKNKKK